MSADQVQRTEPAARTGLGGQIARVTGFLSATRAEMNKVTWPTRDELFKATRMILVFSAVLGLLIGWMDWLLGKIFVDGIALLSR